MSQNTQLTPAQQQAMNLEESICMTASAGTGKTTVLTERYLALLQEKHVLPEQILCLTFTEKAAAEMKVKVERKVRESARTDLSLAAAASSIHKSCIATFHGFCSRVLREFSCEAGVVSGFSIMDDLDYQEYVQKTIDETLQHPAEDLFDAVQELFSYFSKSGITKGLKKLITFWPERREWFAKVLTNPEGAFNQWRAAQDEYLRGISGSILENNNLRRLIGNLERAAELSANNSRLYTFYRQLEQAVSMREMYDALLSPAKKIKADSTKKNPMDGHLVNCVNVFLAPVWEEIKALKEYFFLESMDDPRTKLMLRVMQAFGKTAAYIYEAVEAKKEQGNLLSFDDLITKTQELMNNDAVCTALQNRFQYILVDEVQDNDPALTAIVTKLAVTKPEGRIDEDKRLFIVGDVKQSIYGFKGSYPTEAWKLMNNFKNKVNLDVNFRTLPAVQKVINRVFEAMYPEEKEASIVYSAVRPNRSAETGGVISLQYVPVKKADAAKGEGGAAWDAGAAGDAGASGAIGAGEKPGAAENTAEPAYPEGVKEEQGEALLLASWIKDTVERSCAVLDDHGVSRPAGYGDIAVLYRTRTHASEIKEAFSLYGIPYSEYKGQGFYSCREIYDFYNVIRASVYPEDDTALYGALRSPFFGLTDAEIASAVHRKKGDTLHAKLSASEEPLVQEALALLSELTKAAAALPVPEFLRTVIDVTGVYAVYAALDGGEDAIANIEQFIRTAAEKTVSRAVSVFAFLRMTEVCIEQDLSVEEASADESGEGGESGGDAADKGAVKLMTIHASKGLEFPVTVLMYCDKAHSYLDKELLYDEVAGGAYSSLTFPGEKEKVFGFISAGIKQKALELEYAEHQRLFYVGMTRAQDYLVLVSAVKEGETPKHSFKAYYEKGFSCPAGEGTDVQVIDRLLCAPQASAEGDCFVPEIPSWWACRRCAGTAADAPDETDGDTPSSDAPDPYILKRGSCIHEIFEGRDPEVVCRKYSLMQEREKFEGYLAAFMDSEIMQDADISWCELPLCSAAGEFKRCDRLVRKKDGSYVIVDYKSGKLSALSDDMREKYVKQLTGYSEIVSPVLGEDVVPAYLYFAGDNAFLRIV